MIPSNKSTRETSQPLPTLSTKGWVYGMNEKVDLIFSYYLTSQHSQTLHHLGDVRSLQYTVKEHFSDPPQLAAVVKEDLEAMLKPFIQYVNIDVTYEQRGNGPEYDYTIKMELIHDGYRWENFKTLLFKDSKFEMIREINETGKYSLV